MADARDLSFGENADDLAGANGVAGGLQRLDHFARALFGGNRNDAKDFGQGLEVGPFVDAFVHHDAHLPVGGSQQQHGVHKGNVVADKERAAFFGNVVPPENADAIQRMRRAPEQKPQQRIRHQPDADKRCRPVTAPRQNRKICGGFRCA